MSNFTVQTLQVDGNVWMSFHGDRLYSLKEAIAQCNALAFAYPHQRVIEDSTGRVVYTAGGEPTVTRLPVPPTNLSVARILTQALDEALGK